MKFAKFTAACAALVLSSTVLAASPTSCDTDYFSEYACNSCFIGQSVTSRAPVVADVIFDWKNSSETDYVVYDTDLIFPEFVQLAGSWTQSPSATTQFWKYGDDVLWTEYGDFKEYVLEQGDSLTFVESQLGSTLTLETTDVDSTGAALLVKNTINYREINENFEESESKTLSQCVVYGYENLSRPQTVVPPEPVLPEPTSPNAIDSDMTAVETGPESILLIVLACALGALYVSRRRQA